MQVEKKGNQLDLSLLNGWSKPWIDEKDILKNCDFNYGIMSKPINGNNFLRKITARYLAGGCSLHESRSVSYRRLFLSNLSISNFDYEAIDLAQQIYSYTKHQDFLFKNPVTHESLSLCHKNLDKKNKFSGRYRSFQNWIGSKEIESSRYIPPDPSQVGELMCDWISFINDTHFSPLERILMGYIQFIMIHPFPDGNGRMSRLIFDSFFQENVVRDKCDLYISPFLYQLCNYHEGYYKTKTDMMTSNWKSTLDYWNTAFSWSLSVSKKAELLMEEAIIKISNKMSLVSAGKIWTLVVDLFNQPVIDRNYLRNKYNFTQFEAEDTLKFLVSLRILRAYQLKSPMSHVVYDCEDVFNVIDEIDKLFASNTSY